MRWLECADQLLCVADSRDGVGVYRVFKKGTKTKIRLAAITPFAEALSPMAMRLLGTTESSVSLVISDVNGVIKVFSGRYSSHETSSSAVKDLDLVFKEQPRGLSLIRHFSRGEKDGELVTYDITGQKVVLNSQPIRSEK